MAFAFPKEIVLYDTEYTAWEGSQARKWSGPNEHREIIEIGAIIVETGSFTETSSLDLYIKPRINPTLSDFIIGLTKISQARLDMEGIDFADAWRRFNEWRGDRPAYAFGKDEQVIRENCDLYGILYDYEGQFHNIRELFDANGIQTANYYSSTITRAFGVEPQGSAHNGLSDARSILQGLCLLKAQMIANN
jgi:inhibitor of KinA sporulation pathway (predicted exonuclease)